MKYVMNLTSNKMKKNKIKALTHPDPCVNIE